MRHQFTTNPQFDGQNSAEWTIVTIERNYPQRWRIPDRLYSNADATGTQPYRCAICINTALVLAQNPSLLRHNAR